MEAAAGPGEQSPAGREYDLSDPAGSYVDTARRLVTAPVEFFAALPRGGYRSPLAFSVISITLTTLVSLDYSRARSRGLPGGRGRRPHPPAWPRATLPRPLPFPCALCDLGGE